MYLGIHDHPNYENTCGLNTWAWSCRCGYVASVGRKRLYLFTRLQQCLKMPVNSQPCHGVSSPAYGLKNATPFLVLTCISCEVGHLFTFRRAICISFLVNSLCSLPPFLSGCYFFPYRFVVQLDMLKHYAFVIP